MDESKSLLESLNNKLPALPSEPAEPAEPREVSTVEERGKSPDEVVQAHEARLPASEKEEPQAPPARQEEKLYEVRGVKYTLKGLEEAGLLEDLVTTHAQHKHLQEKYNAQLEAAKAKTPEQAQPAVPQITNQMIAQTYDPIAKTILNDLVQNNLMESDLPEAYPRAITTTIGQLRYAFDLLFDLKGRIEPLIAEINSAKEKVYGNAVEQAFNKQLDALVQKDAKLYAGLKDKKVRDDFTRYLVEEVGANVGQTTGEKAPSFLAKQWVAFNADTMIDAAKNGQQEKNRTANKRPLIQGEGSGSRMGVADGGEQTMLDRMISNSGKISE